MYHYAKHFTLAEAQEILAEVLPVIQEIVDLKETLDEKGYDVFRHQYFGGSGPNGQKVFPTEMEKLVGHVRFLNERGIEIKDLNRGLIDFPHLRSNGDEVYLCYLLGEPKIIAWHSLEGGFPGRREIEEL